MRAPCIAAVRTEIGAVALWTTVWQFIKKLTMKWTGKMAPGIKIYHENVRTKTWILITHKKDRWCGSYCNPYHSARKARGSPGQSG